MSGSPVADSYVLDALDNDDDRIDALFGFVDGFLWGDSRRTLQSLITDHITDEMPESVSKDVCDLASIYGYTDMNLTSSLNEHYNYSTSQWCKTETSGRTTKLTPVVSLPGCRWITTLPLEFVLIAGGNYSHAPVAIQREVGKDHIHVCERLQGEALCGGELSDDAEFFISNIIDDGGLVPTCFSCLLTLRNMVLEEARNEIRREATQLSKRPEEVLQEAMAAKEEVHSATAQFDRMVQSQNAKRKMQRMFREG